VLAGGALVAVIAVFWASLRLLLGETPLSGADAYALGAPRAEEEQKQAVLRALKDLEFERSVGKISDADYAELVAKYRAEAKRLLRLLDADAQPRREQVAALVAKRLRRAGFAADDAQDAPEQEPVEGEDVPEQDAAYARPMRRKAGKTKRSTAPQETPDAQERDEEEEDGERGERETERLDEGAVASDGPTAGKIAKGVACASCATVNDEDAVFCKRCGTKRASSDPAETAGDEGAEGRSGEAS
jgi:hypothetical protein